MVFIDCYHVSGWPWPLTRGYGGDAVALGEAASVGHAEELLMLAAKKDDAAVLEKRRRISVGGGGWGGVGFNW